MGEFAYRRLADEPDWLTDDDEDRARRTVRVVKD
jgi:hypothetical protein